MARKLLEQGVAVVAPVRAGSDHSRLAGVPVELVQADINDSKSVAGYLGDVDIVYHVAGAINAESQEAYDAFNVDAAVALAQEALRENPKLKRFVYISSIAATGPSVGMLPRLESSASNPQTPYGISKVRGEVALKAVKGLPLSIVRPPIVLGPTDGATLPFYQMGQTGLVLGVLGLDRRYSWVDVDDLARGIILAGTHPAALGETFHLTHEDSLGIVEVQEKIVEAYGKTPVKILIPELILWGAANMAEGIAHLTKTRIPLDRSRVSELTENNWVMDSHKAERVLGWTAEITLETCVHRSLEGNREAGLI